MANTSIAEQNPATPAGIWAILRETAEWRKEHEMEAAKWHEEARKEWAEANLRWEETRRLFDESFSHLKTTDIRIGGMSNTFGLMVEHLVIPGMEERFAELGMNLKVPSPPPSREIKEDGQTIAQVDLCLENDEIVMLVEIKARVNTGDITDHIARLEKLRGWYDRRNDGRKLMGTIAGAIFGMAERREARKAGFFVIVQTGDTMKMDVPEGFTPREW